MWYYGTFSLLIQRLQGRAHPHRSADPDACSALAADICHPTTNIVGRGRVSVPDHCISDCISTVWYQDTFALLILRLQGRAHRHRPADACSALAADIFHQTTNIVGRGRVSVPDHCISDCISTVWYHGTFPLLRQRLQGRAHPLRPADAYSALAADICHPTTNIVGRGRVRVPDH